MLGGKKSKVRGEAGQGRVYDFDAEKLKRIAKKDSCVFGNKFTSGTSLGENTPLKPEIKVKEKGSVSEKEPVLETQENEKIEATPAKVVRLGNSFSDYNFEELAPKTKSVCRLTMDFGIETCVSCGAKGRPDWQVTLFDDSWGFLCGPCGQKLSEKLSDRN